MAVIEKGIPLPEAATRNRWSDDLSKMEVGDSIFSEAEETHLLRSSAYSYGRAHRKKFSVRKVAGGFRCWRME